jgi:hypothetical protein
MPRTKKTATTKKAPARAVAKKPAAAKKAKKAADHIKRPLTGYMFFAQAKRAGVVKAHPGITVPDQGRALGKLWKKATEAEKKPYLAKAAADKKRYEAAKAKAGE